MIPALSAESRHAVLRWGRRAVAILVGIDILLGSLTPLLSGANLIPDKWQHFIAYLLWGFVLMLSSQRLRRRLVYLSLALLVGAVIEIVQPMVGREMSVLDFLADLAGLVVGAALGYPARRMVDRIEARWFNGPPGGLR